MYPGQVDRCYRATPSRSESKDRVKEYEFKLTTLKKYPEIEQFLDKKPIFFTTLLSLSNKLLYEREFDYVLVDEAS